jgi:hypothetical protein
MSLESHAEKHSQKIDPHWEMADNPTKTRGHKAYEEFMAKNRGNKKYAVKEKKHAVAQKMRTIKF